MLNRPVDRIIYDAEGRACGVVSQGEYAKCKAIVRQTDRQTDRQTGRQTDQTDQTD